ncbi:MAG: transposase [Holophagales bacterium]|nr:transposase [Holophagales bacterium]
MLIAHKIALDPNNKQWTYFAKAAGCARFAYNWALAEWQKQYEAWSADNSLPKPDRMALRRQLNAIKREQFPWMLEVTKCAPQLAIIQLGQAFQNFFAKRAKYLVFRKKGVRDRFSISNDQFEVIGIEDLNIRGMQSNRRLYRSIADMSFFEFRRQLEYKAEWRGGSVIVADRFFASSKTCSNCGHKQNDMPLSIRKWQCPDCGKQHDRDINAAINLRNMAVSSTVSACGEGGSGCKSRVKLPSLKQEVNGGFAHV